MAPYNNVYRRLVVSTRRLEEGCSRNPVTHNAVELVEPLTVLYLIRSFNFMRLNPATREVAVIFSHVILINKLFDGMCFHRYIHPNHTAT